MPRPRKIQPKRPTPKSKMALDRLTYRELLDLQARIAAAIQMRRNEERSQLAEKLALLAASSGFSLPELIGGRRGAATRRPAVVRYRHPSNPALTWSGRGRRPKWLAKAGRNIERYRVA